MIDKPVKQICLGCTFILTTHVTYYSDRVIVLAKLS